MLHLTNTWKWVESCTEICWNLCSYIASTFVYALLSTAGYIDQLTTMSQFGMSIYIIVSRANNGYYCLLLTSGSCVVANSGHGSYILWYEISCKSSASSLLYTISIKHCITAISSCSALKIFGCGHGLITLIVYRNNAGRGEEDAGWLGNWNVF